MKNIDKINLYQIITKPQQCANRMHVYWVTIYGWKDKNSFCKLVIDLCKWNIQEISVIANLWDGWKNLCLGLITSLNSEFPSLQFIHFSLTTRWTFLPLWHGPAIPEKTRIHYIDITRIWLIVNTLFILQLKPLHCGIVWDDHVFAYWCINLSCSVGHGIFRQTGSVSWLLMPCPLLSPGHQQPWC